MMQLNKHFKTSVENLMINVTDKQVFSCELMCHANMFRLQVFIWFDWMFTIHKWIIFPIKRLEECSCNRQLSVGGENPKPLQWIWFGSIEYTCLWYSIVWWMTLFSHRFQPLRYCRILCTASSEGKHDCGWKMYLSVNSFEIFAAI